MSATLSAGVSSLILKIDTPYDRERPTDIRDDLTKVRVWCSTDSAFVPSNATKVFDGLSLSITIPNLTAGTTYYVKYAFISSIDDVSDTAYTILSPVPASAAPTAAVRTRSATAPSRWPKP